MTTEQKKASILVIIEARGWFVAGVHMNECAELEKEGKIKHGERFSTGGNRKAVWVAS